MKIKTLILTVLIGLFSCKNTELTSVSKIPEIPTCIFNAKVYHFSHIITPNTELLHFYMDDPISENDIVICYIATNNNTFKKLPVKNNALNLSYYCNENKIGIYNYSVVDYPKVYKFKVLVIKNEL